MTDDADRKQRLRALIGWLADEAQKYLEDESGVLFEVRRSADFKDDDAHRKWFAHGKASLAALASQIDRARQVRADPTASIEALAGVVHPLNDCRCGLSDQDMSNALHYISFSLIAAGEDELADRLFDAQQHFRFPQHIEKRTW